MTKYLILGGGMVGSTMAIDLAGDADASVTVADVNPEALSRTARRVCDVAGRDIDTVTADLSDPAEVRRLAGEADVVLGALASVIGLQTLRAVIEAGRPYCDISFMSENALDLNQLAVDAGVTAVVDCGVAPGLSNMLCGFAVAQLDRCDSLEVYVGGLPKERHWPFEYKAAFSPYDVIEEYTRPARLVEGGKVVVREALSEPEIMSFGPAGDLEAFNTDGLRSLIDTLDVPDMKEKTLRYPGHIELMRVFRETGLFSHEPVDAKGQSVRPIDLTSRVLFPKWTYEPGEVDLTVMRVIARGQAGGKPATMSWFLYDELDPGTGCTSMSRTTAFPATIVARMLASGQITHSGVLAPELLGQMPGVMDHVLAALAERGVRVETEG